MLGYNHTPHTDEGDGPERRRLRELHAYCVVVHLGDVHVLVRSPRRRRGVWVLGVFPVEHAVIGGERLAVVPSDALLELPGDRLAVLTQPAVVQRGNFRSQHRPEISIGIPSGQRFIENARSRIVLAADGEMRVQQRGRLPPQEFERPATAAPGRLVDELFRGDRHAGIRQHLRRNGRGESGRIIARVNARRDSLPWRMSSMRPPRSCSFIVLRIGPLSPCASEAGERDGRGRSDARAHQIHFSSRKT
jgi:hypothetical protein